MTQRHISHPEGLPKCADGHRARHIFDGRSSGSGGGHFVECRCKATTRHVQAEAALADWRRINRPARSARKVLPAIAAPADNVIQMRLAIPGEGRLANGS